jgi:hypothetical protein
MLGIIGAMWPVKNTVAYVSIVAASSRKANHSSILISKTAKG